MNTVSTAEPRAFQPDPDDDWKTGDPLLSEEQAGGAVDLDFSATRRYISCPDSVPMNLNQHSVSGDQQKGTRPQPEVVTGLVPGRGDWIRTSALLLPKQAL